MTRQQVYERRIKVQALRKRCPELSLTEIGKRFGLPPAGVKRDLEANLHKEGEV